MAETEGVGTFGPITYDKVRDAQMKDRWFVCLFDSLFVSLFVSLFFLFVFRLFWGYCCSIFGGCCCIVLFSVFVLF